MFLGIESTAHSFGIGLVHKTKVLVNNKDVYIPKGKFLGIVPVEVAKHHEKVKNKILNETRVNWEKIEGIAFSQGPGLPPCLRVGRDFAKELANKYKKPLIGVNHCIAHIEIGKVTTGAKDPIVLFVSGGNTQVLGLSSKRYRIFGETEDISIGNALDSFARSVGIRYPGAPEIERLAKKGKYVELPYVVKGMDLSFSGIITKAETLIKRGSKLEDVCFSLQETCFAMLTEVVERALAHTGKKEVLIVGGVAANQRLYAMMNKMCKERNAKLFVVPRQFSGDNGAMIALLGELIRKPSKSLDIKPRWRTDEVEVTWVN